MERKEHYFRLVVLRKKVYVGTSGQSMQHHFNLTGSVWHSGLLTVLLE